MRASAWSATLRAILRRRAPTLLPVIAVATGSFSFDALLELQPEVCASSLADLLALTRTAHEASRSDASMSRPCSGLLLARGLSTGAAPAPAPRPFRAAARGRNAAPDAAKIKAAKPARNSDRRRAAKLYLEASKLFEKEQFEEAMQDYRRPPSLTPPTGLLAGGRRGPQSRGNGTDSGRGQGPAERRCGGRARRAGSRPRTRPQNIEVTEHLYELGDDALRGQPRPIYEQAQARWAPE